MRVEGKRLRRVAAGDLPALVLVPERRSTRAASLPRRVVLVVEDDAPTRAMLELALTDGGWHVVLADGVELALALARAHRPDAIFLDLMLGGIDGPGGPAAGLAFARAYASTPGPRAPIVLSTAWPISPALMEAVGATATLPKPFDLDDLYAVLERVAGPADGVRHAGSAAPAQRDAPAHSRPVS